MSGRVHFIGVCFGVLSHHDKGSCIAGVSGGEGAGRGS